MLHSNTNGVTSVIILHSNNYGVTSVIMLHSNNYGVTSVIMLHSSNSRAISAILIKFWRTTISLNFFVLRKLQCRLYPYTYTIIPVLSTNPGNCGVCHVIKP